MDNGYHQKRQGPRRKEDRDRDDLIVACTRALRLKDIDHIKDVLRFALEKTELVETIDRGDKI